MLLILSCIVLRVVAAMSRSGSPPRTGDLAEAGLHLLGPCFVLAVAWLSRQSARDLLRMAALEEAALTDPLTGLANRRHFDKRLDEGVRLSRRAAVSLSLITIDIDHFKRINDTYGHAAGDLVLKSVARALVSNGRGSDTVCRVGGEEFMIIVLGLGRHAVVGLAERLRLAVKETAVAISKSCDVMVTVSLGIATLGPVDSSDFLARSADAALYAAKHAGRDRVRVAAGLREASLEPNDAGIGCNG